ncbi:MAG: type II secretion system protein [Planctomycetota bacterium]
MIEILVAISIIAILLGIGAVAMAKLQAEARRKQTQAMLNGLEGALDQYKSQTQQVPNHVSPGYIDWSSVPNGGSLNSSERFVYACSTIPSANEMLLAAVNSGSSKLNKRIFDNKDGADGVNEIYDPWGTAILYRSNNLTWNASPDSGLTGDLSDSRYITKFPVFFSAGPDEEFGTDDDVTTLDLE